MPELGWEYTEIHATPQFIAVRDTRGNLYYLNRQYISFAYEDKDHSTFNVVLAGHGELRFNGTEADALRAFFGYGEE